MSSSYSFSIIGCGEIANKHISALKQLSEYLTPKYCYDIDFSKGVLFEKNYEIEFDCSRDKIFSSDIIIITTPPYTHYKLVKEALDNNCFVVCEKPLFFYNYLDSDNFEKNIYQNSNIITVQQMRFHKLFMFLKKIKNILYSFDITLSLKRDDIYFEKLWRRYENLSGGIWGNQGFHIIDFVLSLFGEPYSIKRDILTVNEKLPWYRKEQLEFKFKFNSKNIENINFSYLINQKLKSNRNFFTENFFDKKSDKSTKTTTKKNELRIKYGKITIEIQNEKKSSGELILKYRDNKKSTLNQKIFNKNKIHNNFNHKKTIILSGPFFENITQFDDFDVIKNIDTDIFDNSKSFHDFKTFFDIDSKNWFYNLYLEIYNILENRKNVKISQKNWLLSRKNPFFIDFLLKSIYYDY